MFPMKAFTKKKIANYYVYLKEVGYIAFYSNLL
jgi:hypothetical protein